MAWTYVGSATFYDGGTATTVDTDSTLHLEIGDVLVAYVAWFGATTTVAVATTAPADSFTMEAVNMAGTRNGGCIGRVVVGTHNETATLRATLGAARTKVTIEVMQFRPGSGETVTKLTGPSSGSATGGSAPQSANFSPSGSSILCVAGVYNAAGVSNANEQIADATSTGAVDRQMSTIHYSVFTSDQTNIHAQSTFGDDDSWTCDVLALNSASGATNVTVSADLLSGTAVMQTPTVSTTGAVNVLAGLLIGAATLFAPSVGGAVSRTVAADLLQGEATLYGDHVSTQQSMLLEAGSALQGEAILYEPTISGSSAYGVTVAVDLLVGEADLYEAAVGEATSATVLADLLQGEADLYGDHVSTQQSMTLEAGSALQGEAVLYEPTVTGDVPPGDSVSVAVDLLIGEADLYGDHVGTSLSTTMEAGSALQVEATLHDAVFVAGTSIVVEPELLTGIATQYGTNLSTDITVSATNAQIVHAVLYEPTIVTTGSFSVTVAVDLLAGEVVLQSPTIVAEGTTDATVDVEVLSVEADLYDVTVSTGGVVDVTVTVDCLQGDAVLEDAVISYGSGWTWGEESPTPEAGLPWSLWKKSTGDTADYDSIWGLLTLESGETFYSDVRDFGNDTLKSLEILTDQYQTGSGSGTVEWRGSATSFTWDAAAPSWEAYAPGAKAWRYVQVRVTA